MKFTLKNVGPIKNATVELGKLTVVCGKNNTGKTILTNTIYEFYKLFRDSISIKIPDSIEIKFPLEIDLKDYRDQAIKEMQSSARKFKKRLGKGSIKIDTSIPIPLDCPAPSLTWIIGNNAFHIKKNGTNLHIDREKRDVINSKEDDINDFQHVFQKEIVSIIIKRYFFDQRLNARFVGDSFSIMSERTGMIFFKGFINTANLFLADQKIKESNVILKSKENEIIDEDSKKKYSLRSLPLNIINALNYCEYWNDRKSETNSFNADIVGELDKLIDGKYSIENEVFYFIPNDIQDAKLNINDCSSSVKALLLLDYYVRYMAEPGDLLVIDEPELNLHPSKQVQLAHFLAMLVNKGINVFITTHSDYIIRAFNLLIQLNQDKKYIKEIVKKEGYLTAQLLDSSDVKAYISQKKDGIVSFSSAKIDAVGGIEIPEMDAVIDKMNQIQDEIIFGEE